MELEELEDGRVRVTLRHHDPDADELWVIGGPAGADPADRRMRPVADGWWERVYELPRDVRTAYWFTRAPMPTAIRDLLPDSRNPRTHVFEPDPDDPEDEPLVASVLELPDAPPLRWSVRRDDVARGEVTKRVFASSRLGNERAVFTYVPPGYDAAHEHPLVVCFDGQAFVADSHVPLPTVLDNLIAERAIPPVVAVLPASLDQETRTRELTLHEPFVDVLVDELLPWAREHVAFTDDPGLTVAAGASLGGLSAAFCAYRRPDRFGLVLSQSGSFQRGQIAEWVDLEQRPTRFYLDAGILETGVWGTMQPLLHANRHLRDVLRAKGYDVTHREFPGGHDYLWRRETVADGLIALLG